MRTGQLRRNDGSLVQGGQSCQHHAQDWWTGKINILGTVIQPGETKEIQIDLGAGVNATVPIFRRQTALPGKAISSLSFRKLNSDSRLRVPAVGPVILDKHDNAEYDGREEKSYFLPLISSLLGMIWNEYQDKTADNDNPRDDLFSSHSRVYEYTIKDIYGAEKSVSAETGILNTNEKFSWAWFPA